jgi:hypothetical protein
MLHENRSKMSSLVRGDEHPESESEAGLRNLARDVAGRAPHDVKRREERSKISPELKTEHPLRLPRLAAPSLLLSCQSPTTRNIPAQRKKNHSSPSSFPPLLSAWLPSRPQLFFLIRQFLPSPLLAALVLLASFFLPEEKESSCSDTVPSWTVRQPHPLDFFIPFQRESDTTGAPVATL